MIGWLVAIENHASGRYHAFTIVVHTTTYHTVIVIGGLITMCIEIHDDNINHGVIMYCDDGGRFVRLFYLRGHPPIQ